MQRLVPPSRGNTNAGEEAGKRGRKGASRAGQEDGADFCEGDVVEVFGEREQQWMPDGEIMEVTTDLRWAAGGPFGPGSLKVAFEGPHRFTWLAREEAQRLMRPSLLPKSPQTKAGTLLEERRFWVFARQAQQVHAQVSKGFLEWWTMDIWEGHRASNLANAGDPPPSGRVNLLGMSAFLRGASFEIWLDNSRANTCADNRDNTPTAVRCVSGSQGQAYVFKAESEEEAEAWACAIHDHAAYAEEVRNHNLAVAASKRSQRVDLCGNSTKGGRQVWRTSGSRASSRNNASQVKPLARNSAHTNVMI